jgi:geranylgeranyl diphosphate synthase type I
VRTVGHSALSVNGEPMLPMEARDTSVGIPTSRTAPARAGGTGNDELRDRIDSELIAFLRTGARHLAAVGPEAGALTQALIDFLRAGGKRLRPMLCYWGWRGAGGADEPAIITAAASLELLHAFALVHDDIMDASETRRGQPTVHRRFTALHNTSRWNGDAALFGTGAGILAGDLCLTLSDSMFHQCGLPLHTLHATRSTLSVMRAELAGGQYLDLVGQAQRGFSTAVATRIIRYKTARYTVEHPLRIGGTLAGAQPALLASYSRFGLPLGEAFQLRDDILGAFGDQASTGKSTVDDFREGKPTWLIATAWQLAGASQRRRITGLYGDPGLDADGAAQLREIITDTGARAKAELLIATRTRQALEALQAAKLDREARTALGELAHAATHRTA